MGDAVMSNIDISRTVKAGINLPRNQNNPNYSPASYSISVCSQITIIQNLIYFQLTNSYIHDIAKAGDYQSTVGGCVAIGYPTAVSITNSVFNNCSSYLVCHYHISSSN